MMILMFLMMFFISSIQPMIMVSNMIVITLLYSYIINKIMVSYWFSYALIMVMLSGVLVIFTYMISLMPNESFENYNFLMVFFFMLIMLFKYKYLYLSDMCYMCLELWNTYIGIFNLFMIMFLFGVMLMVVWLSCMSEGAMRIG